MIDEILDALANWSTVATQLGVRSTTTRLIQQQLDKVREDNRTLWG
jgi:hypothetical protein